MALMKKYAAGMFASLALSCHAGEEPKERVSIPVRTFVCPESIRLTEASADTSQFPQRYELVVGQDKTRLSGVNVFDGHPREGAALLPRSERRSAGATVSVWNFQGAYPHGKYLSCDYADGLLRLTVQADPTVESCTVTTRRTPSYRTLQATFDCR